MYTQGTILQIQSRIPKFTFTMKCTVHTIPPNVDRYKIRETTKPDMQLYIILCITIHLLLVMFNILNSENKDYDSTKTCGCGSVEINDPASTEW